MDDSRPTLVCDVDGVELLGSEGTADSSRDLQRLIEEISPCFPGYDTLSVLYLSNQVYTLRARDIVRDVPVVLKACLDTNSVAASTKIRHEWNCQSILEEIGNVKIPRALESCNGNRGIMLVFANIGDLPSSVHFGRHISNVGFANQAAEVNLGPSGIVLGSFLTWAIEIATILTRLHGRGITHSNINTVSIGVDGDGKGMLFDFSCCTFLEREDARHHEIAARQLPFMSPESSGRINRSVDYRSDFYSLGVCFYFLLTGRCPFVSDNALDLIYFHIARAPIAPHEVCPDLPECLSAIILKLMAKTAEDRYQTGQGLIADLQALQEFNTYHNLTDYSDFAPGLTDAASQFIIPQKLFGRNQEIDDLLACFYHVKQHGGGNVAIIKGGSGMGKSSLVNEMHRPVLESHSFFASGKFDQYKRGVPFFCLLQAAGELIRQLVSQSVLELDEWKDEILSALGKDAATLFDVLPEVRNLCGNAFVPEEAAELGPAEREQRFTEVFLRFMLCFAKRGSPLVLFLDDIQWSSLAEMNLIVNLAISASSSNIHSLTLVIAYRDNEVPEGHHVLDMLHKLTEATVAVKLIEVKSMSLDAVRDMIAATLRCPSDQSNMELETLTNLVAATTDGNAFFITQVLRHFKDREQLFYDFDERRWKFNLASILQDELPATVIDLLLAQIQRLTPRTRSCLQIAACMGNNRFSLKLLAVVSSQTTSSTGKDLWAALQTGLLVPTSSAYKVNTAAIPADVDDDTTNSVSGSSWENEASTDDATFRFLHDRVQQAAYQLISEEERPDMHLMTGFRLLEFYIKENNLDANIFEIVNQINRGLIRLPAEKLKTVIELNLQAGKKALRSTAFEAALQYLSTSKSLAPSTWWFEHFDLTLDINLHHVDAQYACQSYMQAAENLVAISQRARNALEKAQIMFRMIDVYMALDDFHAAIEAGLDAIQHLGFQMPRNAEEAAVVIHEQKDKLDLTPDAIDSIAEAGITQDTEVQLLHSIAGNVLLAIYLFKPEILQAVAGSLILIMLKHGVSEAGAYTLCIYGLTLLGGERSAKARQQGYHLGLAAVKIANRAQTVTVTQTKVLKVFASHICYWMEPPRACQVYFNSAIAAGLKVFNVEYTCSAHIESCSYGFYSGEPLTAIVPRLASYLPFIKKYKLNTQIWYCTIQLQAWTNLMSESKDPAEIDGEYFSMATEYDALMSAGSQPQIFVYYLAKLLVAVYFHRPRKMVTDLLSAMDRYAMGTQGMVYVARYSFFICSALVWDFPTLSAEEVATFYENFSKLQFYRDGAPASFAHEVFFIEAELLRHEGKDLDALDRFETAYEAALATGNIQEGAHFAERTCLWLETKNKNLARKYILRAFECFQVAGFRSKMRDIKYRYPDLLGDERLPQRKQELRPFRNVNVLINRDGTLSKAVTDPDTEHQRAATESEHSISDSMADDHAMSDTERTENTLNSNSSKLLRIKDMPARATSIQSNIPSDHAEELTPTNTMASFLSKSRSHGAWESLQATRATHDTSSSESGPTNGLNSYPEARDLDLDVALKASVMISDVLQVTEVLQRLIESVLMNAGADYGALLLVEKGDLYIEATGRNDSVSIVSHELLGMNSQVVPSSLINYVARLRETTVLGSGQEYRSFQTRFGKDPYFQKKRLRSIMCMPVQNSVKLIGVLYLENASTAYTFGPRRVSLLNFLCTQAAIAIEKARLYHDLGIARDEAQASNRMKSEFLSTISHEIRTPFNAVLGMSGFLLDTKLSPMQIDYVETIRNSSKELLRVIDDILDFSKMEHGTFELHKEDFSLRDCIEGALQITAERAATKELELAYFNAHDDIPDILINDITRFRQIVINLVGNSIKFTEKGSVTVTSHATLLRPATEQECASYRIQVSVRDTGIGIKEDDHKKLFKLFSQIDSSLARNFSGTGLGLAISEKLVRLMNGQIWVESKAGVGSTFHFTITTDAKASKPAFPQSLATRLQGLGVLILDDNEIATRALRESLEWLGMRVLVTRNVQELTQAILTNPVGSFRIALIDLHYGLADEVVPKLAIYDPACKIIRLSRFGFRQKFDDKFEYLIKPVKRGRLAKVVAEALFPGIVKSTHAEDPDETRFNPVGMASSHPLRILLAEDNFINSRVALQHLKRLGYSAVHAKDGQYCLEEEDKAIYDVILMDVQMPRLDGCQAATQIRAKYAAEPERCPRIIAMTANAMRGDMERCLEAGMHAYCQKPIIADILAQRLRESHRRQE